jgi:predicted DNA-binding protein YlxM (UPF0122 family)
MAKNLSFVLLLDCYGELLTQKQREFAEMYYNEDLSLSEIAAMRNITRQAVRDSLKHSERVLLSMEEKLGMAERLLRQRSCLEEILRCCEASNGMKVPETEQIRRLALEGLALL